MDSVERKSKKILFTISYILVIIIGIWLLIDYLFGAKFLDVSKTISKILTFATYFVLCINAFFFTRTKRSGIFGFLLAIFAILIAICLFIK